MYGWPKPHIYIYIYIYGIFTIFLAGKSPNTWSYTVYTVLANPEYVALACKHCTRSLKTVTEEPLFGRQMQFLIPCGMFLWWKGEKSVTQTLTHTRTHTHTYIQQTHTHTHTQTHRHTHKHTTDARTHTHSHTHTHTHTHTNRCSQARSPGVTYSWT